MVATRTSDDRLDEPHAEALKSQQQEHIEGGDEDGPEERDVEEQIERDGAAEHLGQVAGADGESRTRASWASASTRGNSRGRPGPGPCR